MKHFLVIFCFSFTLSLMAQTRTGGPDSVPKQRIIDDLIYEGVPNFNKIFSPKDSFSPKKLTSEFVTQVAGRLSKCGLEHSKDKEYNPLILYIELSSHDFLNLNRDSCAKRKELGNCLYKFGGRKKLDILMLQEEKVIEYLRQTQPLTREEAKRILQFFSEFDRSCEEKVNCAP